MSGKRGRMPPQTILCNLVTMTWWTILLKQPPSRFGNTLDPVQRPGQSADPSCEQRIHTIMEPLPASPLPGC